MKNQGRLHQYLYLFSVVLGLSSLWRSSALEPHLTNAASKADVVTAGERQNNILADVETTDEQGSVLIVDATVSYNTSWQNTSTWTLSNRTLMTAAAQQSDYYTSFWEYIEQDWMMRCVSPVLLIGGTLGSCLSVMTLHSSMFRSSSTSFILTALAVTDAGVLNTGLLRRWLLIQFNVDIRLLTAFGCKIHVLLTYYLHQLSSWTLILLTTERAISVWFPLKCKMLCSKRRAVGAWITVVILLFGLNAHFLVTFNLLQFTMTVNNQTVINVYCTPYIQYYSFLMGPWYWIDDMIGSFIPFGLIFIGNSIIVFKIVSAQKSRSDQMRVVAKDSGKVSSTTVMLIVVSILFLLLSVPYDSYYLALAYGAVGQATQKEIAVGTLASTVCLLLYYTNNAINFILYFISGQKFRTAFISMFWCRRGNSTHGDVTSHMTRNDTISMSQIKE